MKGDFTRRTFKPFRSYSSVLMQQGRVQLDSDWNEQAEIGLERERRLLRDIIGPNGTTQHGKYGGGPFQLRFTYNAVLGSWHAIIDYKVDDEYGAFSERIYVDGELVEQVHAEVYAKNGEEVKNEHYITYEVTSTILPDGRKLKEGMFILSAREGSWGFRRFGQISAISGNNVTIYVDEIADDYPAANFRIIALYEYFDQPYYINPPALPTSGTYVAYLDIWRRHVTATEAPSLREAALGGADTTTRTQTVWQLKLIAATEAEAANQRWTDSLVRKFPGAMTARYNPTPGQVQSLENRLYRVEIHKGGKPSAGTPMAPAVTFKWSRDNGMQAAPWIGDNGPLRVGTQGREEALGFAAGQWIELSDDERDFKNLPGAFVQISAAPSAATGGQQLPVAVGADTNFANYHGNPKVRRWDSAGSTTYPLDAKPASPMNPWIPLENGIEVMFDPDAEYKTGDYWLIPARPNLGGIEWPQSGGQPAPQPAQFTEHIYQAMNFVDFSTTPPTVIPAPASTSDLYYQLNTFYSLKELTRRANLTPMPVRRTMPLLPVTMPRVHRDSISGALVNYDNFMMTRDSLGSNWYLGIFNKAGFGIASVALPHGVKLISMTAIVQTDVLFTVNLSINPIGSTSTTGSIATIQFNPTGGAAQTKKYTFTDQYISNEWAYMIEMYCPMSTLTRVYGFIFEYEDIVTFHYYT